MNIDTLTLGELKQIAALMNGQTMAAPTKSAHPFIGKFVIARCYAAGVHAGILASVDGENVMLHKSVRLWSWAANDGVALSGVAQTGLKTGSKVDVVNPQIYLTGVCELIPCSPVAEESINGFNK